MHRKQIEILDKTVSSVFTTLDCQASVVRISIFQTAHCNADETDHIASPDLLLNGE